MGLSAIYLMKSSNYFCEPMVIYLPLQASTSFENAKVHPTKLTILIEICDCWKMEMV
jgi:hypothetical protein